MQKSVTFKISWCLDGVIAFDQHRATHDDKTLLHEEFACKAGIGPSSKSDSKINSGFFELEREEICRERRRGPIVMSGTLSNDLNLECGMRQNWAAA